MAQQQQSPIPPTQSQPKPTRKYIIFQQQDFKKISQAQTKLYTTPLKTLSIFGIIYGILKFSKISKLLPNPLAQPQQQSFFGNFLKKKNSWLIFHSVVFVCIASTTAAFFAKQFHAFQMYTKYQKEVNCYIRWKLQEEIKKQIRQI